MALPDEVLVAGGYRIALYALVALVALAAHQWRHWPILAASLLAIASNAALLTGHLSLSGLIGVVVVSLTAWIFIVHMRTDRHTMKVLLAAKESDWSKERHDLLSELYAAQGTAKWLRDKYEPEPPEVPPEQP